MARNEIKARGYNPALLEKLLEDSPDGYQRKITLTPN
jgi:hypothetical protein